MGRPIPADELEGAGAHVSFLALLKSHGLPKPTCEYLFCERLWRFDYCWPDAMVALEVDGGAFTRGRHTRGKGFIEDQKKRNRAVTLGWRVLHTTPDRLVSLETIENLKGLLFRPEDEGRAIKGRETDHE